MTGSNLSPGVSEDQIPGNRSEGGEWDAFHEWLGNQCKEHGLSSEQARLVFLSGVGLGQLLNITETGVQPALQGLDEGLRYLIRHVKPHGTLAAVWTEDKDGNRTSEVRFGVAACSVQDQFNRRRGVLISVRRAFVSRLTPNQWMVQQGQEDAARGRDLTRINELSNALVDFRKTVDEKLQLTGESTGPVEQIKHAETPADQLSHDDR